MSSILLKCLAAHGGTWIYTKHKRPFQRSPLLSPRLPASSSITILQSRFNLNDSSQTSPKQLVPFSIPLKRDKWPKGGSVRKSSPATRKHSQSAYLVTTRFLSSRAWACSATAEICDCDLLQVWKSNQRQATDPNEAQTPGQIPSTICVACLDKGSGDQLKTIIQLWSLNQGIKMEKCPATSTEQSVAALSFYKE